MAAQSVPPAVVILDSEAVQALADVAHPKHRDAVAIAHVVSDRRSRRPGSPRVVVPVAVRIEAGWDRRDPTSAFVNWLTRATDWPLVAARADEATRLRADLDISVVDATIGQAADESPRPVAIVTSDVGDMARVAAALEGEIRIAHL